MLKKAQRPVINIAGGGVHYSEAWDALQNFSESLGIPVVETFAGKGAIRKESELLLGGHGLTGNSSAAKCVSKADLVICVGTRLTDFATGSQSAFNHPEVRFISLNVTSHDAYKQGALPILGDAREGLRALSAAAKRAGIKPRPAYVKEVTGLKKRWNAQVKTEIYRPTPGEAMSQGELIGILNAESKAGDTIVAAAGSPPGDLHKLWDVSGGTNCQLEFGFSCMGYEIPAGLGVRMAQPKGEVYVFIGDGTYLMNPTELVTASQEGLKITLVLSENHGFQCIRGLQMARAGRSFGNEFRARDPKTKRLEGDFVPIDFAMNAESMGARTWSVRTSDGLRQALREAREEKSTAGIVVETEKYRGLPGSGVWWDVAPAEVSKDSVTRKLRAEYEAGRRKLQRFHY